MSSTMMMPDRDATLQVLSPVVGLSNDCFQEFKKRERMMNGE